MSERWYERYFYNRSNNQITRNYGEAREWFYNGDVVEYRIPTHEKPYEVWDGTIFKKKQAEKPPQREPQPQKAKKRRGLFR